MLTNSRETLEKRIRSQQRQEYIDNKLEAMLEEYMMERENANKNTGSQSKYQKMGSIG